MTILAPADGYRSWSEGVWVIVRDEEYEPTISADGVATPGAAITGGDGYYHFRVEGLEASGSRLKISHEGGANELLVYGPRALENGSASFHSGNISACWQCHDDGNKGCRECHSFGGHKHAGKIECTSCHDEQGRVVEDVAPVCSGCHKKYTNNRHPRLRHAVTSPNDPLRPGKRMDCASCHDPHAPNCLSCLSKKELRKWCKGCHTKR